MPELSASNAAAWLAQQRLYPSPIRCTELGGGVSNKVILAEAPGFRVVIKQSLGRLRVEEEWLSDRSRIFREAAAMQWLAGRIKGGRLPKLLHEDREDFAIVMEAVPEGAVMWKEKLFAGELRSEFARAAGTMLGSIVAASWNHPEAREIFGDRTVFGQLRIDPYYRFTAARHPDVAIYFIDLIARSANRVTALTHGDWSPKNLLVSGTDLWAIDWEVIHFGDPSFDAAFLLNHLLLKSVAMPQHREALARLALAFLAALHAELPAEADWVPAAALEHLPALLLARVDGKSPAEYLDAAMRDRARRLALDLIGRPMRSIEEAFAR